MHRDRRKRIYFKSLAKSILNRGTALGGDGFYHFTVKGLNFKVGEDAVRETVASHWFRSKTALSEVITMEYNAAKCKSHSEFIGKNPTFNM